MEDAPRLQIVDSERDNRSVGASDDDDLTRNEPDAIDGGLKLGLTQDFSDAQVQDGNDAVLAADRQQFVFGSDFVFVD